MTRIVSSRSRTHLQLQAIVVKDLPHKHTALSHRRPTTVLQMIMVDRQHIMEERTRHNHILHLIQMEDLGIITDINTEECTPLHPHPAAEMKELLRDG